MAKALTILGMVIAVLIFALFGLDLATPLVFSKANIAMDIGAMLSAAILGYLSWATYREQK